MVKALPYLKLLPPNSLIWRDTLYIQYKDGTAVSISLLSKIAKVVDDYLNGKVSEIVIESDEIDVKLSIQQAKFIANGLVAEYLFWEGSGNILHDSSGNDNNGTIYNATWSQLPNGKWTLYFNGTDAYVEVPNSSSLNTIKSAITIEILEKVIGDTGAIQDNVHREYAFAGPRPEPSSGKYVFWINIGMWVNLLSSHSYLNDINKWKHLIGWYDGKEMRIYINNVLDSYKAQSGNISPSTYPLCIGRWSDGPKEWFYGYIALVRIFNRAITDTERECLYNLAKIMVPELP